MKNIYKTVLGARKMKLLVEIAEIRTGTVNPMRIQITKVNLFAKILTNKINMYAKITCCSSSQSTKSFRVHQPLIQT